jgi:large subunit ribosomal protein L15
VTTRYYTKFAIEKIFKGEIHPIHSRLFMATPITRLAVEPSTKEFPFLLPDPVSRKELEYYRDFAKRGYLSYMVPPGHGPSLYFAQPGIKKVVRRTARTTAKSAVKGGNLLW